MMKENEGRRRPRVCGWIRQMWREIGQFESVGEATAAVHPCLGDSFTAASECVHKADGAPMEFAY
jgi:hypothetical protein